MRSIPTLLRLAEHQALSKITLSGTVLDLGGDSNGEYRSLMRGDFVVCTVNMDPATDPDIVHDLEAPLPVEDNVYGHTLLINVLEHIYHAQQLVAEAVRVTTPGGTVVIVVPFMFPIHADPGDYWRFSDAALIRMCTEAGLEHVSVEALGTGVFSARYLMLDRLLPTILRAVCFHTLRHFVVPADKVFSVLARILKKKYQPHDYALGYCVRAYVPTV